MHVNIQDLLHSAELGEPAYPGKRLVKKYMVPGQYKSHCVVFDWRAAETLHVELLAGTTGRHLDVRELKNYPVSFQAPTYLDIAVENDNAPLSEDGDEDGETSASGKGGGGKRPASKKGLENAGTTMNAFGKVTEGKIPGIGMIEKFVVMGKELAKSAYETAFNNLKEQLSQTKVMAMDLMKGVGNVIKRATPGGGLEAKGNETIKYKYDQEKTGPMFGAQGPG
jgi:hypothetical protein